MEPRINMNRQRAIRGILLGLMLVLVCCVSAMADDQLKVTMDLSDVTFTEPKEITVSISVTNTGDTAMPGPVTLRYPSGKQVEEFGEPVLEAGASRNWTGTWLVSQQELEAGKIAFSLKYPLYNEEGTLINKTKNFTRTITYVTSEPVLNVTRTIRPTTAQKGQSVTVTYDIENAGSAEVTDVTIRENSSVSSSTGTIDSIPAGETGSYSFSVTMGTKDLTSSATITYKSARKSYSQKVEAAVIHYGQVNLTATLSADKKGGAPGDTVKLTVKLKNTGDTDYTNLTLTDDHLGEVFTGVSVAAGQTETLEKEITITESQDILLTVTGEDAAGEPVETATGKVSIIATDPTKAIVLSVNAEADRDHVYEIPGKVRFTITVNNESAVDVSSINVRAVNTDIYTFESIPAGESRSFTREMAVSMAGTFQFTASCRNELGETLTFLSNALPISFSEPTPEPTEAPIVTPPAPQYEYVPQSYDDLSGDQKLPEWTEQAETVAGQAKWYLGGAAALLLLLLIIGAIRRAVLKHHSNQAMDHLEGATYRDYSTQPKRNRRSEIYGKDATDKEQPKETAASQPEHTAQDSELMAETLQRLYKKDPAAEDAGESNPSQSQTDSSADATSATEGEASAATEGTHRRRSK